MGRAVLEAEAVVSGFEDVAVVGEPVGERPVSRFCSGAVLAQVTSQMIHL